MIILDYRDRRPIYEQIVERFQELMVTGALAQDSQMPSVRSMAMDLSINPNTIQRAYAELERQGYIYTVKGKGSFVADNSLIRSRQGDLVLAEQEQLAKRAYHLGLDRGKLAAVIDAVYEKDGSEISAAAPADSAEHGAASGRGADGAAERMEPGKEGEKA